MTPPISQNTLLRIRENVQREEREITRLLRDLFKDA